MLKMWKSIHIRFFIKTFTVQYGIHLCLLKLLQILPDEQPSNGYQVSIPLY
jgi:hypothetical protein